MQNKEMVRYTCIYSSPILNRFIDSRDIEDTLKIMMLATYIYLGGGVGGPNER